MNESLVHGQQKVYLYGPQIIAQGDAVVVIGKILGKDIKVTALNELEGVDQYIQAGVPKPIAEYTALALLLPRV